MTIAQITKSDQQIAPWKRNQQYPNLPRTLRAKMLERDLPVTDFHSVVAAIEFAARVCDSLVANAEDNDPSDLFTLALFRQTSQELRKISKR